VVGAVVSCGARTELRGGDAAAADAMGVDAQVDAIQDETGATPYCATLVGPVATCDAGPDAGYVIECPSDAPCQLHAGEWGCCYQKDQLCFYANPSSTCP
jgi:hypothetical protein